MMHGITVGMPVHNSRKTLEKALDSALSQTIRVPYEIIVVDDGSTDTSANIALSYSLIFPEKIRLIRTENRGVAAARNLIVQEARFDHLTWLDSDDYYYPEKLEVQYDRLMINHMLNKSMFGDPDVLALSPFKMGQRIYSFANFIDDPIKYILTGEFRAYLWASLGSTLAYRETGKFNESLHRCEDTDWLLRFLLRGNRQMVLTHERPLMTYHFSTARDGRKVEESFQYLKETYGDEMRRRGVYDEYVPRRYWEIAGFYHTNKNWNEMWRCRALAAAHDPARFGRRLNDEIASIQDVTHRRSIQSMVDRVLLENDAKRQCLASTTAA